MALNYQLKEIENHHELAEKPGLVQTICFAAMFTGCPRIEDTGKHGWREFYQRVHMWETAFGPLGQTPEGEPQRISPELCKRFTGLSTNASPMTSTQFARRISEGLRNDAKSAMQKWDRKQEADQ